MNSVETKKQLEQMFIKERMTVKEIAEEMGYTIHQVRYMLRIHNIKRSAYIDL